MKHQRPKGSCSMGQVSSRGTGCRPLLGRCSRCMVTQKHGRAERHTPLGTCHMLDDVLTTVQYGQKIMGPGGICLCRGISLCATACSTCYSKART